MKKKETAIICLLMQYPIFSCPSRQTQKYRKSKKKLKILVLTNFNKINITQTIMLGVVAIQSCNKLWINI